MKAALKRFFNAVAVMLEVFFSPHRHAEVMKPEEDPQITLMRGVF